MTIVGIDGETRTLRAAEHELGVVLGQLGPGAVRSACTHLTRTGGPHVVLSVELADPAALNGLRPPYLAVPAADAHPASAAGEAATAHRDRTGGRAVVYPGHELLTGVLEVGEVLARTAIERVVTLLAPPTDPAALLDTRGFVRPEWIDGVLTLRVVPSPGGMIAPFEVPDPTPCCAAHG